MRRKLVAGNWKMNGTQAEATALVDGILSGIGTASDADVAVCPPFILIPLAAEKLNDSPVAWGGQDMDTHTAGAYTGEISGGMLRDYGCTYVIVGHSERRSLYGEDDATVAEKFKAAQDSGLVPILCVGELLEEREADQTEAVVGRQLDAVVNLVGIQAFAKAVIAYEPVWAIGTGKTASPEQAQAVHAFIRGRLAVSDSSIADGVRILYGGSVKAANAAELFSQTDVDGGLIGGASLQAEEFLNICRAAK
jgi:triosephosphate isomerase